MLRGCSKGAILLVSAIFFALVHHSFFSFGYAFVAGVIFMAIDLALDSVIPSILIHFINNALSVGMLVYKDNEGFAPAIYALVVILSVLSFAIIIANKKKYKEKFASIFKVEERIPISMPIISFALVCVAMAVFSIL
jgi:membrane protease YdiL (CAAX protease family)